MVPGAHLDKQGHWLDKDTDWRNKHVKNHASMTGAHDAHDVNGERANLNHPHHGPHHNGHHGHGWHRHGEEFDPDSLPDDHLEDHGQDYAFAMSDFNSLGKRASNRFADLPKHRVSGLMHGDDAMTVHHQKQTIENSAASLHHGIDVHKTDMASTKKLVRLEHEAE